MCVGVVGGGVGGGLGGGDGTSVVGAGDEDTSLLLYMSKEIQNVCVCVFGGDAAKTNKCNQ